MRRRCSEKWKREKGWREKRPKGDCSKLNL